MSNTRAIVVSDLVVVACPYKIYIKTSSLFIIRENQEHFKSNNFIIILLGIKTSVHKISRQVYHKDRTKNMNKILHIIIQPKGPTVSVYIFGQNLQGNITVQFSEVMDTQIGWNQGDAK